MKTEQRTVFNLPYAGIGNSGKLDILYGSAGELSAVCRITNPVAQYSASEQSYSKFQNVLVNLAKILGEGYILQKQDIFIRQCYAPPLEPQQEYLQQKYQEHFNARPYTNIETYLTITKTVKKGLFYTYDEKAWHDFNRDMDKVFDLLKGAGMDPQILREQQINHLVKRILSMDFANAHIALDNIRARDQELQMGDKVIRCLSLVNTDTIDLPEFTSPWSNNALSGEVTDFPLDNMFFLSQLPAYQTVIYNQLIEIPSQRATIGKLQLKRKRHSGVPDAANLTCVEDIDRLLVDVARENQLIVSAHFSIIMCAKIEQIDRISNFVEAALFERGIIPSRNAYNQLELLRCALPGNGPELKRYDWFLTTAPAALCFFYKESLAKDEQSDFLVRFTDRQGIPVAIDPVDLPMRTNRINNRNKFVLGPSGSGKSFFMNALVQQYLQYNMDVVIVDTGHSYSGLCAYFGGRYITYSEKSPITMNPFAISEQEYSLEKKDYLVTLVALLWKGVQGTINNVDRDVVSQVISQYYDVHFLAARHKSEQIAPLSFNTFYEFALEKIPQIMSTERIPFDIDEFRFVLKKFYRGGEYESILNENTDASLFEERFIVFEIDSIKNHAILFPIVTLVIMDVFISKAQLRKAHRKALILEEAWKALASPLMAEQILYLYKTVRKFWGEAIVVTQELHDIIDNPVVKGAILSNSDTVCLLDQSKFIDNYSEVARLLSISPSEQKKIFTIGNLDNKHDRGRFKEVYIRRGAIGEVYGVEVSISQYFAFTTEKPEKRAVERYARRYGNYQQALEAITADLSASGLSLEDFVHKVNSEAEQAAEQLTP
ncbi:MAG: TraG family conjugative transposon ATPase [Sphingobacterium sp.]